jgi:carbonic anhydrase-like protein
MELGPDLPLADFTSTWTWDEERIHAMALYCSDGRWGLAFDEFCQKHLRIPRYDRWAVPGGPAWLLPSGDDTGFLQAARRQLDFLVEAHGLERIVLITHYGCAYYAQKLNRSPDLCLEYQKADLHRAAVTLHEWYPAIRVENFLAMRSGSRLSFHEVR